MNLNDIRNEIITKIEKKQVTQRSRKYFLIVSLASMLGCVFVGAVIIYCLSFVLLVSREFEVFELFGFGPQGVMSIMQIFPWLIVLSALIGVMLLTILIHQYACSYKKPMVYTVCIIIIVGIVATVLIKIIDKKMHMARMGESIPVLRTVHRHYRQPHQRDAIIRGVVVERDTVLRALEVRKGKFVTTVLVTNATKGVPFETITIGDMLIILAKTSGKVEPAFPEALGIRTLTASSAGF